MSVLKERLKTTSSVWFILYGGMVAFATYFAMYAFRKPYAAGTFETVDTWWTSFVGFKSFLVIAQILGYALSKVIGVKVISEMTPERRAPAIIGLIAFSWFGLILFGLLPTSIKPIGLFVNGLPLGMIWGLVFSYLEGRRLTEILGAILSASFIVSSGIVKSVALWLMNTYGVTEFWMPAATGLIFFPVLFIGVWGLLQIPDPSPEDIEARTERKPMNGEERMAFLEKFGTGIVALVAGYILLTIFRDFRDDFAVEIWAALGFKGDASVLTQSELVVAIFTLAAFASLIAIKNNLTALMTIHGMSFVGAALIGLSAFFYQSGSISPMAMMIGTGTGLYIAYMPFGAMLFERLIAASREVANAGFLIYVADASGYLGTVAMLLYKNFFMADIAWLSFFLNGAYVTSIIGMVFTGYSAYYFYSKLSRAEYAQPAPLTPAAAGVGGLGLGSGGAGGAMARSGASARTATPEPATATSAVDRAASPVPSVSAHKAQGPKPMGFDNEGDWVAYTPGSKLPTQGGGSKSVDDSNLPVKGS